MSYKSKFTGEEVDDRLTLAEQVPQKVDRDELSKILDNVIRKDGYYPDMTVGKADNLVGRGEATEEYINFRASAGELSIEDGTARIAKVKGNSLVWNQQLPIFEDVSGNYHYDIYVQGGNLVVSSKREASPSNMTIEIGNFVKGHKYLVYAKYTTSIGIDAMYLYNGGYNVQNGSSIKIISGVSQIFSCAIEGASKIWFLGQSSDTVSLGTTTTVHNWLLTDLTQMFGSGNEPLTIEEFNERKPIGVDEYVYDGGTIVDMNVDTIVSVGDNLLDFHGRPIVDAMISQATSPTEFEIGTIYKGMFYNGTADYASVTNLTIEENEIQITGRDGYGIGLFLKALPNFMYRLYSEHSYRIALMFYDKKKVFISAKTVASPTTTIETISPNDTAYCMVYLGSKDNVVNTYTDTTLNLVHSNYKDIKYTPYEEDVKDLSWVKGIKYNNESLFPNGLRSAGTANDEVRYNRTTNKWEAIKRIGEIDLGNLDWMNSWSYDSTKYPKRHDIALTDAVSVSSSEKANILCAKYATGSADDVFLNKDLTIGLNQDAKIVIYDSNYNGKNDIQAFKQSLQGVTMYYELANPIVVELEDNLNLDYLIWDFGTEEAIAIVPSAPFRADIIYQFNAVDRIRNNSDKIAEKQDTLTLSIKNNGNIVIGKLAGQTKEFMPATPSGDPMHYAYEAEGAVWNASTGYWEFYDMKDITNEQMRRAYSFGSYNISNVRPLAYVSPSAHTYIRFNLPRQGMYSQYVSDMSYFAYGNYIVEVVNIAPSPYLANIGTMQVQAVNLTSAFGGCSKLRRVFGRFDCSPTTNVTSMFSGCTSLEDVHIYGLKLNISFADSPLLSKESLLYMITNCASNATFTITLHPDVYAKCQVDGGDDDWYSDINNAIDEVDIEKNTVITLARA